MDVLTGIIRRILDSPVADETGISGDFDIRLDYALQGTADSTLPSLFTAVQEQLGLRLERRRLSVETLVIDHAEHPTPD